MSRLVRRKIEVTTDGDLPLMMIGGDSTHRITKVIDRWMESGAWWENEPPRTVYRVQTAEWFVFDLEFTAGEWFIYRVWD